MRNETHCDEPRDSTDQRLISAGMDILVEKGYLGATTREIARAAGVTEVTLYRHFRSKDELLSKGILQLTQRMVNLLFEPTGNIEQDLLLLAKSISTHLSADIDHIVSILPELSRNPVLMREDVQKNIQSFSDKLQGFFRYYQQTGTLTADVGDEVSDAFVGPMFSNILFSKVVSKSIRFDYELHVKHYLAGYLK